MATGGGNSRSQLAGNLLGITIFWVSVFAFVGGLWLYCSCRVITDTESGGNPLAPRSHQTNRGDRGNTLSDLQQLADRLGGLGITAEYDRNYWAGGIEGIYVPLRQGVGIGIGETWDEPTKTFTIWLNAEPTEGQEQLTYTNRPTELIANLVAMFQQKGITN